ncbi:MAG: Wzt carbohydrate-binding domain-containing protein [Chlorobium sp.]|nr:Wzt carbohydrate-binding domain-containing protein [Chlorobium sp.]
MSAITVTNLGKAYKQYPNRWSRLAEWILPGHKPRHHLKWVLQGINFTVNPGEAVGIIGINGAGKSTLLKMITGTTQPTTGSVQITGRVAALLELGMGFHPDFTGRQNVFMAGQLLGLSVAELVRLMPEIEAFAEIGDYIDQPVRVYSSGMQVRLAFSVATAVRPDVLIVDEALSVGDKYFSQKSFMRIQSFLGAGTSLLFVSHDAVAVKALCDRAILLHEGYVKLSADPETVIDLYNGVILSKSNQLTKRENIPTEDQANTLFISEKKCAPSVDGFREINQQINTGEVGLVNIQVLDSRGIQVLAITTGDRVRIRLKVKFFVDKKDVHFGFAIRDRLGITIHNSTSYALGHLGIDVKTDSYEEVEFDLSLPLHPGHYAICIGIVAGYLGNGACSEYLLHVMNAEIIEVHPGSGDTSFGGIVNLFPVFSVCHIDCVNLIPEPFSPEKVKERDADLVSWELAHLHFTDADDVELQIIRQIRPYTLTLPSRILTLLNTVKHIFANQISGDFVECGVWRGGSSMAMALMLLHLNDKIRSIYMYDTFSGMPTPGEADDNLWGESALARHEQLGGNGTGSNWAFATYEDVLNNMNATGFPGHRFHLVPGLVEDTLPSNAPEQISLLRLDTDWYQSTRHELEHLIARMPKGGIVLVDDYGHWKGSQKAVDEHLAKYSVKPYLHRIDYAARLWIVE